MRLRYLEDGDDGRADVALGAAEVRRLLRRELHKRRGAVVVAEDLIAVDLKTLRSSVFYVLIAFTADIACSVLL